MPLSPTRRARLEASRLATDSRRLRYSRFASLVTTQTDLGLAVAVGLWCGIVHERRAHIRRQRPDRCKYGSGADDTARLAHVLPTRLRSRYVVDWASL